MTPTPGSNTRDSSALFVVGCLLAAVTLLPMLACGGCVLAHAVRPKSAAAKAVEDRDAAATEFALPHLQRHGIESLHRVATIAADGQILLVATGIDDSGKRHDVKVFIRGNDLATQADWKLDRIDLDDQIGVNDDE